MRLIDKDAGHLFTLPPANVILLAPRPDPHARPVLLRFVPPIVSRSLVVHHGDGTSDVWEETAEGWRRKGTA